MTDRVATARAQLVWPTVPIGAEDEAALDMLASVLGGLGKESRLYRTLVYDKQLASGASASHGTQALAGTFDVVLSARPGKGLDELVELADAEIARMKAEGPTEAEIAKALARTESGLILGLQSITRKADFLNQNNVVFGDPLAYKGELAKFYAVTPEDVKRVANKYLTANRIRLDVTPGAQAKRPPEVEVDRAGQVDVAVEPVEVKDTFDRSKMPEPGPAPKFAPPPIVRRTLSNGLKLVIGERHTLPILSMRLIARGGGDLEPKGAEGLASITADLMTEGTAKLDSLGLSGALAEIGASLGAGGGREEMSLSLTTLTKHADRALELFADVLLHPAFPEKELERLRALRLAALARRADNPQAIASLVFPKTLYGADHPYGSIETMASVKGITREQVVELFGRVFKPNNATLIVVGDTTPDAIVAKLETILKDWKPGDAPTPPEKPEPKAAATTVYLIDKPGAAQSVLFAGLGGPLRNTPDYIATEVMNSLLGGQFSSRINLNLREDKGYTYGAQTLFLFRQGPGAFIAATSVQTAVTAEALAELVKELKEVASSRPPTEAEVADAKNNLIKGFPGEFETTQGLAGKLAEIVTYDLPDDDFTTYQARVEAITPEDAAAVAKKYVNADGLVIVVVGDRATIEPKLKELPFAKSIKVLDPEGNPAEDKGEAKE
jgi:zinc protease